MLGLAEQTKSPSYRLIRKTIDADENKETVANTVGQPVARYVPPHKSGENNELMDFF
jgi:hypothetical protein